MPARCAINFLKAVALSLFLVASGCGQHQTSAPTPAADLTPEMQANLARLNHEFRRTMVRVHLTSRFSDFVAARPDLQIPAPPAGKRYAISPHWKVILVDGQPAQP